MGPRKRDATNQFHPERRCACAIPAFRSASVPHPTTYPPSSILCPSCEVLLRSNARTHGRAFKQVAPSQAAQPECPSGAATR